MEQPLRKLCKAKYYKNTINQDRNLKNDQPIEK